MLQFVRVEGESLEIEANIIHIIYYDARRRRRLGGKSYIDTCLQLHLKCGSEK